MNTLCKKFRSKAQKTGIIFSRFFAHKQFIIITSTLLFIPISYGQLAAEPLRVDPTAIVERGAIQSTSILTDDFGQVFLEIPERVYIAHENDQTSFTGEIMPPKAITIPAQTPKTRQREVFSFELVSDSGETLVFSDKINLLPPRQRLRLIKLNDGKPLEGAPKPKLIYIVEDENIQSPKLWRFINSETGWQRVGGLMKELDESRRIFSVYINQTGKYSIIDEDPAPIEIPAEMRQDPTYESIESINSKILELEKIRAEIMAREQGLLFEDETGFTPDFLFEDDFDIDTMTDEEFFDAFFDDQDLNFLESEDSDTNVVDPDPWEEAFVIPSIDSQTNDTELIPAEFTSTKSDPLPGIDPATGLTITNESITTQEVPTNPPTPEMIEPSQTQKPDNQITTQTPITESQTNQDQNQTLPAELPRTGESKTVVQKLWEGFKALFIVLALLGIPGYLVWEQRKS